MRKVLSVFCLLLLFSVFCPPSSVSADDAADTMRKVRAAWEAADEESIVTAVTTNRAGRAAGPPKIFRLWQAWKPNGQDLARIKFTAPTHSVGFQLLTEGERQWFKVPGVNARPVFFDKGEGGTEFVQTAFTHEDLRSLNLQAYRYALAGTLLVATPVKLAESAYSRLEVAVDRSKWAITEIRYFGKDGTQVKALSNYDWQEAGPGIWRPRAITMVNLTTGRKTEVSVTFVGFKRVPGKVFSPAELEK